MRRSSFGLGRDVAQAMELRAKGILPPLPARSIDEPTLRPLSDAETRVVLEHQLEATRRRLAGGPDPTDAALLQLLNAPDVFRLALIQTTDPNRVQWLRERLRAAVEALLTVQDFAAERADQVTR